MIERFLHCWAYASLLSANIIMICLQTISHRVNRLNEKAQLWLLFVVLCIVFISCWMYPKRKVWAREKIFRRESFHVLYVLFERGKFSPSLSSWMKTRSMNRKKFFIQLCCLCDACSETLSTKVRTERKKFSNAKQFSQLLWALNDYVKVKIFCDNKRIENKHGISLSLIVHSSHETNIMLFICSIKR